MSTPPHETTSRLRVAVLCAVYNRRDVTLRNLVRLQDALLKVHVEAEFFVLDDGSTDGTAFALKEHMSRLHVVQGTGSLYWAGGMHAAYAAMRARSGFRPTHYLLVNDDVTVDESGLENFFRRARDGNEVLVGRTVASSGAISYGGYRRRAGFSPLAMRDTGSVRTDHGVDTFNCNFVLISAPLYERLGGIDGKFGHGYGDLDLGLRLGARGIPLLALGQPIGLCERNVRRRSSAPLVTRLRTGFVGALGVGPYARFVWRHGPKWRVPVLVVRWTVRRLRESTLPKGPG